jgi:hypothetical protein
VLVVGFLVVDPGLVVDRGERDRECTGSTAKPGSTTITGEVFPFLLLAWITQLRRVIRRNGHTP